MTPQECFDAVEECGAPIVSIAGGEPLIHPRSTRSSSGMIARKIVYLCTNALLLEKNLHKFTPSPYLIFSVHLDGVEKTHDRMVCRQGRLQDRDLRHQTRQVEGLLRHDQLDHLLGARTRLSSGNSSTTTCGLGLDGMMISPATPTRRRPSRSCSSSRSSRRLGSRRRSRTGAKRAGPSTTRPFYLDFLEGKRDYDCTPWGNPLRNVFGWQRPCYLMDEGGYAKTYSELLETTDWSRIRPRVRQPKVRQLHDALRLRAHLGGRGVLEHLQLLRDLVADFASIKAPRKVALSYPRSAPMRKSSAQSRAGEQTAGSKR